MTDRKLFEMKSSNGPVKPLFGFAIEDYMEKYGYTKAQLANEYGVGIILNGGDTEEGIKKEIKDLSDDFGVLMFVFGFDRVLYADFKTLETYLNGLGYSELKDVYEDRVVFAKEM